MNMTTAITKHTERMPIISRYRRWRYAMSSVRDRRACVTRCTDSCRPESLVLTLPRYAWAPNPCHPAGRLSLPSSTSRAHRGHVEALDADRRHRGPVEVVAPLARQRWLGGAHLEQPPEHADRRLVEPEVVHRARHLAVLHQVDPVPGEPGEPQGLRADLADVPQAGEQQPAPRPGEQLLQ